MTYLISTVAEMTGIPRNTLLAWERRYGLVQPIRHENGYRSYSEADVTTILRLKNAMALGLRVGEAVELIKGVPQPAFAQSRVDLDTEGILDLAALKGELVEALIHYRRAEAEAILQRLLPISFHVRLDEVIFPALREIGDLWQAGQIGIAEEHYASAILRGHLAALLITVSGGSSSASHAVTTTFAGDNHEIAALALAIQLSISGFRVSYLGPNLAASELVAFSKKFRPALVCVSCILQPTQGEFESYLEEIAALPQVRWVIGGSIPPEVQPRPHVHLIPNWKDFRPIPE